MNKSKFLISEAMQFSIQAGFAARNKLYPIYNVSSDSFTLQTAKKLKDKVRLFLNSYYEEIKNGNVTEDIHYAKIVMLSKEMTNEFNDVLFENRFRIGISQKVINLFLKYLWCFNYIEKPFHCPFDNIIKIKLEKFNTSNPLVDWTMLDSIKEYKRYVNLAKIVGENNNCTIADWELKNWRRR